MSVGQFVVIGVARINLALAQESPVCLACKSLLVANPSASGAAVAEYHGIRLYLVEHLEYVRVVVVVLSVDGALVFGSAIVVVATVGTVKPYLKHLAVVGEEVAQLCVEVRQIVGCGIFGT